jgi:hypothetical protein
MEFVESNMMFSCSDKDTFPIEKSDIVNDYDSLKVCEFFAMINGKLTMIEAKSSSPQPRNKEKFDEFIAEIGQKFIDTLLMFNAIMLERHEKNYKYEFPDSIKMQDIGKLRYALYLVVHGNETEWMIPIQDALKNYLRHVLNAWNIPDVNVYALNHEAAQAKGLIKQYLPVDVLEQFKRDGLKDKLLLDRVEQWLKDNP